MVKTNPTKTMAKRSNAPKVSYDNTLKDRQHKKKMYFIAGITLFAIVALSILFLFKGQFVGQAVMQPNKLSTEKVSFLTDSVISPKNGDLQSIYFNPDGKEVKTFLLELKKTGNLNYQVEFPKEYIKLNEEIVDGATKRYVLILHPSKSLKDVLSSGSKSVDFAKIKYLSGYGSVQIIKFEAYGVENNNVITDKAIDKLTYSLPPKEKCELECDYDYDLCIEEDDEDVCNPGQNNCYTKCGISDDVDMVSLLPSANYTLSSIVGGQVKGTPGLDATPFNLSPGIGGIKFSGNNESYLSFNKDILLNKGSFSLSIWVKHEKYQSTIITARRADKANNDLELRLENANNIIMEINGIDYGFATNNKLNIEEWNHFVLRRNITASNFSDSLALFLNGGQLQTAFLGYIPAGLKNPLSNVAFVKLGSFDHSYLPNNPNMNNQLAFKGQMAKFLVYDYVVDEKMVNQLFADKPTTICVSEFQCAAGQTCQSGKCVGEALTGDTCASIGDYNADGKTNAADAVKFNWHALFGDLLSDTGYTADSCGASGQSPCSIGNTGKFICDNGLGLANNANTLC